MIVSDIIIAQLHLIGKNEQNCFLFYHPQAFQTSFNYITPPSFPKTSKSPIRQTPHNSNFLILHLPIPAYSLHTLLVILNIFYLIQWHLNFTIKLRDYTAIALNPSAQDISAEFLIHKPITPLLNIPFCFWQIIRRVFFVV